MLTRVCSSPRRSCPLICSRSALIIAILSSAFFKSSNASVSCWSNDSSKSWRSSASSLLPWDAHKLLRSWIWGLHFLILDTSSRTWFYALSIIFVYRDNVVVGTKLRVRLFVHCIHLPWIGQIIPVTTIQWAIAVDSWGIGLPSVLRWFCVMYDMQVPSSVLDLPYAAFVVHAAKSII
jgi:hypothetical protein